MTAEIALLNKQAIALAADSAITIDIGTGRKIFLSANKIFTLSKYHPVGIMVWNNANFMGIPWETIIKIYRKKLHKKSFDTLEEYASDFIKFLQKEKFIISETNQENYVRLNVYIYFMRIFADIRNFIELFIRKFDKIQKKDIQKIREKIINKHYRFWKNKSLIKKIPKDFKNNFLNKYEEIIEKAKNDIFNELYITKTLSKKLTEISFNIFVKFPESNMPPNFSGIVIAGYGNIDFFPKLRSYLVDGLANNFLKFREDRCQDINHDISSLIVPFAQAEMVHTFMEGINPDYDIRILGDFNKIISEFPKIIINAIKELDDDKKNEYKSKFKLICEKKLADYIEGLQKFRRKNYVDPIIKIVSMLPKTELAAMAESLINLTSLKRRVSTDEETVGGPIDVAIISKGDGFIWIKRKHYFESQLNPQFFYNYNLEE